MNVGKASYKVVFAGRDITTDISRYLLSLTYSDKTQGASDEIEIVVEDTDSLWRNDWFPQKGDTLDVTIGLDGVVVPCGVFEIDEVEMSGPPDQVSIRGLATGIKSPLRTKNSYAFEQQSLKAIAETVGGRHGLTVSGEIDAIQIERATQNRETDLGFLARIAAEFGYVFNLRGLNLVFTTVFKLEESDPVTEIDRTDLIRYSIRDKTSGVFKSARTQYHNPQTDKLQTAESAATDDVATDDVLEVRTRAENDGQAETKAKAALHDTNSKQQSGNITLPGSPLLLAGSNFDLTGMGVLSGKYHVVESSHRIDAGGGYTTDVEIKRVGFINKSRYKPKTKRATRYKYTTVQ
jgi:uncharacterized protein